MAFVLTSAIVICTPGPTVLMVIADALAHHKRHAWSTVLGVGAGDLVAMTVSLAGAGALLRTSAQAFMVLKWIGGVYLIYLGGRAIVASSKAGSAPRDPGEEMAALSAPQRFANAFTVTVSNPKLILFFVAFVPQFISTEHSFVDQSAVYVLTFDFMAMINASLYAMASRSVGRKLSSQENQRRVSYAGGGILLAAGILVLLLKMR